MYKKGVDFMNKLNNYFTINTASALQNFTWGGGRNTL